MKNKSIKHLKALFEEIGLGEIPDSPDKLHATLITEEEGGILPVSLPKRRKQRPQRSKHSRWKN